MKLKPYSEYKDSGVEWIGEVPVNWDVVPLTKFLESKVDYRGKTPEKVEKGVFLVTGKNIKEGKIDYELSKEYVPKDQYNVIMSRGKPVIGDLLFTTEAPLGEVANVDHPKVALAQRIIKMRGKEGIVNNYFLKYYIMSKTFQDHLQSLATGSTALGIKASKLFMLRLILPPYLEQSKIIQYIDNKTAEIDLTIEKDTRLIERLKEKRTALINHVVTKGLDPTVKMKDSGVEWIGEIPEDWEVKKLKLISTIVLGKMLNPLDKGGYYLKPYLRAQNILWEKVNTGEIKEMWFSKNELNSYRLQKDDLLVSEGGEVGRTAIWKEELSECYIQNSVHKVTLNPENNPKYFLYAFESCGKSNFFSSIVNRVSIAHLTREKLKEITFPVPNRIEQDRITNYLDVKIRKIDQTIQKIQENIDLLEEYKKSLIHHVVTGKVNVLKED